MLSKKYIIILLFQFLFCYSIFDHVQDFKIPSSTYIASINNQNLYNFYNPSCNDLSKNRYLYSSYGNYFDGILKNQSIYFSINSDYLKKLNFSIIKSSIDNIYNTTNAWNDNGDGIIDITEIDYQNITTFNHNTLGIIISKSFRIDQKKYPSKILPIFLNSTLRYGVNSKFSFSSVASEKAFSHSFDLGLIYYPSIMLKSSWIPNIGLLIKDFLPYSYWSTGQIENKKTLIIIGSSISFTKKNVVLLDKKLNQKYFYISADFNLSDLTHSLIGCEYQIINNNNLISFQMNTSSIEHSIGFTIKSKDQFDIAYSFVIPQNNELYTSQKIMIGINSNILSNYIK
ncbi:MAG: hypothetical protein CMG21_00100 [Candidatus Marinimicrobia bacterium]|nr:hypothetical protein [Candidatus Neomarinimicrobiota bacterium]|tara:strand:+ start:1045 stop:2070 length:1026 start_codon:yes stop_codon:yes gene_type:complete